jgi:uridylate kinase
MLIVIKLSGESLGKDNVKYFEPVLKSIAVQIKKLHAKKHKVCLVVGGGNLFRGRDLAGKLSIDRPTADYIGMLATVQNALVLRDYFESCGIATRVSSAIAMPQICESYIPKRSLRHLEKGRVVVFASGLGAPFFSTDSTAVQRALELKADILVMAKSGVDGLYTADPKKDPKAKKIKSIRISEVLEKNLKIADLAAIALAKDHNLTIKVVGIDAIAQALEPNIGSTINP